MSESFMTRREQFQTKKYHEKTNLVSFHGYSKLKALKTTLSSIPGKFAKIFNICNAIN